MLALLGDLEDLGSRVVYHTPVEGAEALGQGHRLRVGGDMACELRCEQVVNAAGLQGVALAEQWGDFPPGRLPRFFLARGHYFSYAGAHSFTRLIYPMPEPGGLGVHLTLAIADLVREKLGN